MLLLAEHAGGMSVVPLSKMIQRRSCRGLIVAWLVTVEKEERQAMAAAATTPLQRSWMHELVSHAAHADGARARQARGRPWPGDAALMDALKMRVPATREGQHAHTDTHDADT